MHSYQSPIFPVLNPIDMPTLAQLHPQVVHFVVVLMLLGVAFRVVSLTGKLKWTNEAAATLLIIGAIAAYVAHESGVAAHGPVERIPGARAMVQAHEADGILTYRIFVVMGMLELVALGLAMKSNLAKFAKVVNVGVALVGVWGCYQVYETAEHGGELVYNYAGGPGLRSGKPEDIQRLLLAGLYNQSRNDRKDGKLADAAALNAEMAKRFPADTTIQFLMVESLLLDSKDPKAAMTALGKIGISPTDTRWRPRQANLKADAFIAMGKRDSARAVIADASAALPANTRLKARLDSLKN